jgi:beta-lactamase regulating signal transducer with metallopeptidase domain
MNMDKLFLQIFNTAITAGWLVLAVLAARLLLKKAPAWIKCALWALVALRLVWPFSLESVLSLLPSTEVIPQSQLYVPAPQVHTGITALNAAINPGFSEAFQAAPTNSVNPLQVALWIAGLIWVLGVVAMVVYAIVSYLRLYRQVRIRVPAEEGVYLCDQIHTPFILGIFKPKIYLPSDLPKEKWDSILAHERAHLIRRDHWWKPLGFVLLTVFWFHPLLWLAYILLCRDVELACDERVIKGFSSEEKQAYSAALLECSIPGRWITACPLAFGETGVKQRIRAVLHYKKPTLWILVIAIIACTVLAVGFLTDPVQGNAVDLQQIAGKQFVYTGEGAGSSFYINLHQNGTFQYYAGVLSSYVGMGQWELKGDKLYLHDTTLSNSMLFVFEVTGNGLKYIAKESHPFMYVNVKDGDLFVYHADIPRQTVGDSAPGPAKQWHPVHQGMETGEFQLAAFPERTFCWGDGKIEMIRSGKKISLVENATIYHVGAVDLNLDGYSELCATVKTATADVHVYLYDIANEESYTMQDPGGAYAYWLYAEYVDGSYYIMCAKEDVKTERVVEAGRLVFEDGAPAIRKPSLHTLSSDTVTVLYDMNHPDSPHQGKAALTGMQGVSVRWYYRPNYISGKPVLIKDGKETTLFEGFPTPMSLYIADVTGDGKPDLCADVYYFFSGLPSFNAVCVYDCANDRYYLLGAQKNHMTQTDHYLRIENGKLVCDEWTVSHKTLLATGTLCIEGTGDDAALVMKPIKTYDPPKSYVYGTGLNRVTVTVIHEGSAWLSFGYKPEDGIYKSGSLQGSYEEKDDMLFFYTEDRETYVFRFEGEDLVFQAKKSDKLPDNCILPDGAILKADSLFA